MFFVTFARTLVVVAAAVTMGTTLTASEIARAPAMQPTRSPVAEPVKAVLDGWRQAEAYAAAHPGCEVFVGRGDSMLPLYRDRTVLVVQTVKMSDLRTGMAVVFIGDRGALVAHTLLENTLNGWRAIGVGNREPDRTRVSYRNLVGVIVKAYAPALPGGVVALQ